MHFFCNNVKNSILFFLEALNAALTKKINVLRFNDSHRVIRLKEHSLKVQISSRSLMNVLLVNIHTSDKMFLTSEVYLTRYMRSHLCLNLLVSMASKLPYVTFTVNKNISESYWTLLKGDMRRHFEM